MRRLRGTAPTGRRGSKKCGPCWRRSTKQWCRLTAAIATALPSKPLLLLLRQRVATMVSTAHLSASASSLSTTPTPPTSSAISTLLLLDTAVAGPRRWRKCGSSWQRNTRRRCLPTERQRPPQHPPKRRPRAMRPLPLPPPLPRRRGQALIKRWSGSASLRSTQPTLLINSATWTQLLLDIAAVGPRRWQRCGRFSQRSIKRRCRRTLLPHLQQRPPPPRRRAPLLPQPQSRWLRRVLPMVSTAHLSASASWLSTIPTPPTSSAISTLLLQGTAAAGPQRLRRCGSF